MSPSPKTYLKRARRFKRKFKKLFQTKGKELWNSKLQKQIMNGLITRREALLMLGNNSGWTSNSVDYDFLSSL